MGEPKGLVEAIEKLTLFLMGLNSGAFVPRQEVAQKIELSPTDNKLEGVTNYRSWSRRALPAVDQKELDGYLLGTVEEPGDKTDPEEKKLEGHQLFAYWVVVELGGAPHWTFCGGALRSS